MKNSFGRSILLAAVLALVQPLEGPAQEFFRDLGTSRSSGGIGLITPSEYSYQDGSPSGLRPLRPGQDLTEAERIEELDRYNFALGNLRFAVAAGAGIEWNDNITLSDEDRKSDFIFRPSLDIDARWRLTELNTLRLNLGASYAKYFEHSELDTEGILLSPNSELALTFFLGTIRFTIRDRFSYQEDTYELPVISNQATYQRYENQAGIQMDWAINQQLDLVVGYDHYNLWTTESEFETQDRSVDTIFVRPGVQLTPPLKVGLSTAVSYIDFESEDRADGTNLLVGPFIQYQVSEYTNLYLEAGVQSLNFDGGSDFNNSALRELQLTEEEEAAVSDLLRDEEDTSSWYAKLEINNRPSDFFQHRLSGSKTSEVGFGSNFYDLYHIEYSADWKLAEKTELGPSLFYEYYETSGDFNEEATRYGATVGIRHHISNSITLGLDYRFLYKDSNVERADYYQNLAFLSVYYKF
jgi:opacity protein-like surface antigen